MDRNGFFQISKKSDGIYLRVTPPQGEGKSATVEELVLYLDRKQVKYNNVAELRKAFNESVSKKCAVKFTNESVKPFNGWIEYHANKEGSELQARMYPPLEGMKDVTLKDVEEDFQRMKIKFGVKKDVIEAFLKDKVYLQDVVFAEGTEPVEGRDAELKYYFSTEHVNKPKMNEDGTVDFHKLDVISSVKAGDVVAEIIPEDKGVPGRNIYGVYNPPRKVARKVFKYGRNLQVSEDGCKLVSLVTGHVTLENGKIMVSNEFEVASDVDNSVGDIEFDGNVYIKGNVLAGFKVTASGDVIVNGVVEGAEIKAGGDIVLQRGILGMDKGILEAGGNITAKFIENANVKSGGDIDTNAIMHSNVSANGIVDVHGKKGSLTGGVVRAGSKVVAKIIGSEMGTSTVISVGTDPELILQIEELKSQILEYRKEREKLVQVINRLKKKLMLDGKLSNSQMELLNKTVEDAKVIDEKLEDVRVEYRNKASMICEDADARVQIVGSIYPGTKIEIGESIYFVSAKNDHCQYVKQGADIVRVML